MDMSVSNELLYFAKKSIDTEKRKMAKFRDKDSDTTHCDSTVP